MTRPIITVILLIITTLNGISSAREYYPSKINGSCGESLKTNLGALIAVHQSINTVIGKGSLWAAFRTTDSHENGNIWSIYTSEQHKFSADGVGATEGMDFDRLISPTWYGDKYPFTNPLSYDLHHITPCPATLINHKKEYPAGEIIDIIYSEQGWKVGYAMIGSTKINAFEVADDYKGDIARMIMYIATKAATSTWQSFATNIFLQGNYPTLNRYAIEMLLRWHRNDAVSQKEIDRNNAVYALQGNRNPFIDYPQMVEHIWGTAKDTPFYFDDEDTEIITPLKSKYKISEKRIYLYSPFIPIDVQWRINNIPVNEKYVSTQLLGIGIHELKYSGNRIRGKILITIEP